MMFFFVVFLYRCQMLQCNDICIECLEIACDRDCFHSRIQMIEYSHKMIQFPSRMLELCIDTNPFFIFFNAASTKQEVGEESKLARSFERIRSLVRKGRGAKENADNEQNTKLEKLVNEIVIKRRAEKSKLALVGNQLISLDIPEEKLREAHYQVG